MGKIKSFFVVGLLCCLFAAAVNAAAGDIYVGGLADQKVYKYPPAGGNPTTFVSNIYSEPIAFDRSGNLFVGDRTVAKRVVKVTPDGTATTVLTQVDPTGLLADINGNLFVSDYGTGTIIKLTPQGAHSVFASGINGPYGIAPAPQGNLYVAENISGRILKVAQDGTLTPFIASGLNLPAGLVSDATGTVYEADSGSGNVYMFSSAGAPSTVASGISAVLGLALDPAGNLFASAPSTKQIYKVPPGGTKTIFASGNPAGGLAFEPASNHLLNISTRADVLTDDSVAIAGFIVTGTVPKDVYLRGLGPTLAVNGPLQDPVIQLVGGSVSITNDDWQQAANANSIPVNMRPADPRESAILTTLQPGGYSVILSGKNRTTGIGQIEVFDFSRNTEAELANISTRAFAGTGENILDGGFIALDGNGVTHVVVRGKGPSLADPPNNIPNVLADPTLELHDGNGALIASNDDWKDTQQAAIERVGLAPGYDAESALVSFVGNGGYSVIIAGKNGATGVAQVEVFRIP